MCKGSNTTSGTNAGTTSGSGSTSGTATTTPNASVAQAYQDLINNAQGVAATPFQTYGGQFTAPVNPQQYAGINSINNYANSAQPYLGQAAQFITAGGTPLTSADINKYYSPYNQQVVQATQNLFNTQNAEQQQGVIANAAAQGALGGDRVGVAQGQLARQQQLAEAPVLAGLENTGYNQAVQLAQQQQGLQQQAGYGLANVGQAVQGAGLQGAGAQIGAGTLEQQTQQADLNAQYAQFLAQQGYPFQSTQWLAGILGGIGPQLGGTTTQAGNQNTSGYNYGYGTQTAPPPNQATQYAGLGLAGLSMLPSGTLSSMLPFAAAAAGGGGVRGFDDGGSVIPYGGGRSYVPGVALRQSGLNFPTVNMGVAGAMMPTPTPQPISFPKQDTSGSGSAPSGVALANNTIKLGNSLSGVGDKLSGYYNQLTAPTRFDTPDALFPGYDTSGTPMAARGGPVRHAGFGAGSMMVRGYANAGLVRPEDEEVDRSDLPPIQWQPPASDEDNAADANALALSAREGETAGPVPAGPDVSSTPEVPAELQNTPAGAGAEQVSLRRGVGALPSAASAYDQAPQQQQPEKRGLFGLPALSDDARRGLLAAAFGMLSSRSPHFGVGIGQGGLAGLEAYRHAQQDREAAQKWRAVLAEQARAHGITEAHYKASEANQRELIRQGRTPSGFHQTESGDLERTTGGPHDPAQIEAEAVARAQTTPLTPEAKSIAARQLINGDMSWTSGLGRGKQADIKLTEVRNEAASVLKDEYGLGPKEAAEHIGEQIQRFKARGVGMSAEERTLSTREANLGLILRVTNSAIPAALEESEKVDRLGWRKPNELIQAGQLMTSAPELKKFGMANLQLAEGWARAMNPTGIMRESDRDLALKYLSTAENKDVYKQLVMQLKTQINRELEATRAGKIRAPGAVPTPGESAPAATAPAAPAGPQRWERGPDGKPRLVTQQ